MSPSDPVTDLQIAITRSKRYDRIYPELVRRIAAQELQKRKNSKEALKHARGKLHQIGGAFISDPVDFSEWKIILDRYPFPADPLINQVISLEMMGNHISTRERLPYLEDFYPRILEGAGNILSVLDLGCGLNPLTIPWMPLSPGFCYYGCDIYLDLVEFNQAFLDHAGIPGKIWSCDITEPGDYPPVDLTLLLKTLPLMEQIDRNSSLALLQSLHSRIIVVSFPRHSIGGRSKGMTEFYSNHFNKLVSGKDWHITRYEFPGELVFRIEK